MFSYDVTVRLDFGYISEFLKAHEITQMEFTNSLGYSANWFNKRRDAGGNVKWRIVKGMLDTYALDPKRLIKEDPMGIFSPKEEAEVRPDALDEILSAIITLSSKIDMVLKKEASG